MVILWCVYYGKRRIIFREEKRGSKVCCFTYSSIYPPSLRGETWLRIILSIIFSGGAGYCLKLFSFLQASEALSSLVSMPLCVPVLCSGRCSAGASRERRGRVGAAGLGAGEGAPSPSLPSSLALPGAETFPAAHPSPRAAASQLRISSAGEERKFKAWLCLCEEPWGCWLEGDGSQSGSLWGSLEWKKFCSAVVLGSCQTGLAAVPSWEVALGMLGGTSVPRDLGRKLLFTPIYSGVLPEVAEVPF